MSAPVNSSPWRLPSSFRVQRPVLCVALAALILGSASCANRSEVVLIVDTNLQVGAQIDRFVATVTTAGGLKKDAVAWLGPNEAPPPRTLGILYDGGGRATNYRVDVAAQRVQNGVPSTVLVRSARFSFTEGSRMELRMSLLQSCLNVTCAQDFTCTETGCTKIDVVLAPYSGSTAALSAAQTVDVAPAPVGGVDAGP